jgi:hypothetical protein
MYLAGTPQEHVLMCVCHRPRTPQEHMLMQAHTSCMPSALEYTIFYRIQVLVDAPRIRSQQVAGTVPIELGSCCN